MSLWPELAHGQFRMHYVDAGGVRTRCLSAGEPTGATPVLLLHGSGGHLEAYTRNILAHAERGPVLAIDMLGHGYTDKPDHPYEIHHYVDHVLAALDALGLTRVDISGESLGGWVAAALAAGHPGRVRRLVLNTAGGLTASPQVMDRLRELSLEAVRKPDRESVRKRLEWLMHDKHHVSEDLVDMRYRIYTQPGFARAMEHIMCLQIMDIRQRNMLTDELLGRIQAPTLVIWTDHDPTGAIEVGQRFRDRIADSRLEVMKGCGHWPQFEDAATFNALQIGFLSGD